MVVHKTFTNQTGGLSGNAALRKRERLRDEVAAFIAGEIDDDDVINIDETDLAGGELFSVTIWYKKR
ncbi:MAG: hypothetical protein PVH41_15695 [Anaerolineae bacterium]